MREKVREIEEKLGRMRRGKRLEEVNRQSDSMLYYLLDPMVMENDYQTTSRTSDKFNRRERRKKRSCRFPSCAVLAERLSIIICGDSAMVFQKQIYIT